MCKFKTSIVNNNLDTKAADRMISALIYTYSIEKFKQLCVLRLLQKYK